MRMLGPSGPQARTVRPTGADCPAHRRGLSGPQARTVRPTGADCPAHRRGLSGPQARTVRTANRPASGPDRPPGSKWCSTHRYWKIYFYKQCYLGAIDYGVEVFASLACADRPGADVAELGAKIYGVELSCGYCGTRSSATCVQVAHRLSKKKLSKLHMNRGKVEAIYRCPNGPPGTGTTRTRFGLVQIVPGQARLVNGSGRAIPAHVLSRVPKHGTSMSRSCRAGPKAHRA
jgi:hypothetical protein